MPHSIHLKNKKKSFFGKIKISPFPEHTLPWTLLFFIPTQIEMPTIIFLKFTKEMKRKTRRSLAGRDGVDAHQARIPLKPLWLIIFCQPATEGSHSTRVVCGKRF
jgi:hypothetical protein